MINFVRMKRKLFNYFRMSKTTFKAFTAQLDAEKQLLACQQLNVFLQKKHLFYNEVSR